MSREPGVNPKDQVGAKKAPLGLVPPALTIGAAEAMLVGAEKYGPFNWRTYPVQVMTYIEAAYRHLGAFVDGQDCAEDTGVHHLKHAAAGLGILLDSIALGIAVDNRPPKGPAADLLRAQDHSAPPTVVSAIAEKWGAGDGPVLDAVEVVIDAASGACGRCIDPEFNPGYHIIDDPEFNPGYHIIDDPILGPAPEKVH